MVVGAIELGGTKTIMAVGDDPLKPLAQTRIATGAGPETLEAVEGFFRDAAREHSAIGALGIAAFGPLDLDPDSAGWGHVLGTVKPGWSGVDIAPRLSRALGCPAAIDTDVNAAALAEYRLGAGQGCDPLVYLTVGTGIGGGLAVGGAPVRGLMHPEMGHIAIRRHADDDYPGICTYHGDCAEGLASGPSIVARFGCTRSGLPADHPFHAILADYLGQLCAAIVFVVSPRRIVMGGGVMDGSGAHGDVAEAMRRWLGGYVAVPRLRAPDYIAAPRLEDAGLIGAFLMAQDSRAAARA